MFDVKVESRQMNSPNQLYFDNIPKHDYKDAIKTMKTTQKAELLKQMKLNSVDLKLMDNDFVRYGIYIKKSGEDHSVSMNSTMKNVKLKDEIKMKINAL